MKLTLRFFMHETGPIAQILNRQAGIHDRVYLNAALNSDLNTPEFCEKILAEIELVERGELKDTWFGGQDFYMDINRDGVRFEHAIFGECPEWPIWHCSLAQYKSAVQGWKKFLEMPKTIDSELIVELPD